MRSGLRRLAAVLVFAGLGLVATTAASTAQPAPAGAATAVAPLFNISGGWSDFSVAKVGMSVSNSVISVDMSLVGQPTARGTVVDPSTIAVTFRPRSGTVVLIGKLQAPGTISWSNGTTWTKVFGGVPVFNTTGNWTDNATGSSTIQRLANGFIAVDMSGYGRPNAPGFMISATRMLVNFPDSGAFIATLEPDLGGGTLRWSNGSTWQRPPIR